MKNLLFLIALIFASATVSNAQTGQKTVTDYVLVGRVDSFFLDEITTTLDTTGKVITVQKNGQLYRSREQLIESIKYLKNQTDVAALQQKTVMDEAEAKAKKTIQDAKDQVEKLKAYGEKTNEMAKKIDAALKRDTKVFGGPQPQPQPKKKKS